MNLGHNLKLFRLSQKLNQTEFARRIGSSQQCISNYEQNVNEPSVEWLARVAHEFNVSIDFLVGYSTVLETTRYNADKIELFEIYDSLPDDKKVISKEILKILNERNDSKE